MSLPLAMDLLPIDFLDVKRQKKCISKKFGNHNCNYTIF